MGFYRQEYWSGLPFSSPGDLPNPGIEPGSSSLQVDFFLRWIYVGLLLRSVCSWEGLGARGEGDDRG